MLLPQINRVMLSCMIFCLLMFAHVNIFIIQDYALRGKKSFFIATSIYYFLLHNVCLRHEVSIRDKWRPKSKREGRNKEGERKRKSARKIRGRGRAMKEDYKEENQRERKRIKERTK